MAQADAGCRAEQGWAKEGATKAPFFVLLGRIVPALMCKMRTIALYGFALGTLHIEATSEVDNGMEGGSNGIFYVPLLSICQKERTVQN
jgi:hypothetical protein